MSYCRWSSDKFKSAVYVYEATYGGWTTHVATNKTVGEYDGPDPYSWEEIQRMKTDPDGWRANYNAFHTWLDTAERAPLGLAHDGETFHDDSPGECANTLRKLRDMGYHVPAYAIEILDEEQKDFDAEEHHKQIQQTIRDDLNG